MTFTEFDGSTIGARSNQLDLMGKIRSEVFEIVGAVVDRHAVLVPISTGPAFMEIPLKLSFGYNAQMCSAGKPPKNQKPLCCDENRVKGAFRVAS
ncbi:hypothetical protein [Agrobacterium fabrum]|uniref:hypothetical protein n=1 Tax=Agrobacterium fabrum TaxID=1176649 RepID=UPI0009BAA26A|nr:hypothetical protein [Agrobacterium fabrum]